MFVTVYEKHIIHLDKESYTNSTFEDLLSDCVVLVLLDVGVKLPGQNHYILFHLKETQEAHQSGLYRHTQTLREHTEEVFQREAPTWYWELKLNENFMESVVMVSAITEGGGRAAAEKEQVSVEFVCFYLCFWFHLWLTRKYFQWDLFVSSGAAVFIFFLDI